MLYVDIVSLYFVFYLPSVTLCVSPSANSNCTYLCIFKSIYWQNKNYETNTVFVSSNFLSAVECLSALSVYFIIVEKKIRKEKCDDKTLNVFGIKQCLWRDGDDYELKIAIDSISEPKFLSQESRKRTTKALIFYFVNSEHE